MFIIILLLEKCIVSVKETSLFIVTVALAEEIDRWATSFTRVPAVDLRVGERSSGGSDV